MLPKDRQKMCTHCDGRIPFDAEGCPYCGASVPAAARDHHQSIQDSLTTLYTPPYGKNKTEPLKEPMVEKRFNHATPILGAPTIPVEQSAEASGTEANNGFWPILLLSIGANLLILGLLQLFFSDQGFLRLEWDSSYWFVYCLAALPLFFFGFKRANKL